MAKAKETSEVDLMPGGTPEDVDLSDLRVNFSSQEAESEALDFEPVPAGKYPVAITDVEVRFCGPESKNPGKPYWAVEMTVQEGKYENRKFWGNVMLFEGALYSLAQLLKATGNQAALDSGKIPEGQTLVGKQMTITVAKVRDTYREKRDGDGTEKFFKNEVKGYRSTTEGVAAGAGSSGSLLP